MVFIVIMLNSLCCTRRNWDKSAYYSV